MNSGNERMEVRFILLMNMCVNDSNHTYPRVLISVHIGHFFLCVNVWVQYLSKP